MERAQGTDSRPSPSPERRSGRRFLRPLPRPTPQAAPKHVASWHRDGDVGEHGAADRSHNSTAVLFHAVNQDSWGGGTGENGAGAATNIMPYSSAMSPAPHVCVCVRARVDASPSLSARIVAWCVRARAHVCMLHVLQRHSCEQE